MKQRLFIFFLAFFSFLSFKVVFPLQAQEGILTASPSSTLDETAGLAKLPIYFFYSKACPHCAKEKAFLGFLEAEYEDKVNVYAYEVSEPKSIEFFREAAQILRISNGAVPVTVIGSKVFPGYGTHEGSGVQMQKVVENCLTTGGVECEDSLKEIADKERLAIGEITFNNEKRREKDEVAVVIEQYGKNAKVVEDKPTETLGASIISVPFLGEVDAKQLSLPVMALLIGFLDGFNPCAMWVLLFLISLLFGIEDKRKRWLYGLVFIISSAFVYFLFMAAWLNAFLFFGMVSWVRIGIALFSLGVGVYHLYEYYRYGDTCKVTSNKERQLAFAKLKQFVLEKNVLLAMGGLVLLAFAVNLVELLCSAGFPAIFTSILALSNLPTWQYYGYIFIYLLVFMLDDLVVFTLAMLTLESKIVGEKYAKYSKIIGGILMLLIGILLLIKPEWLLFS